MSQSFQQAASSANKATAVPEDDWSGVTDANERRKIQNRIAQRKFRKSKMKMRGKEDRTNSSLGDKARQLREENERAAENQRRAGGAYTTPEPEDIDDDHEEGLPWGGISLRHVFETGRSKEQSSRETSINTAVSRAGGSSR